MTEESFGSNARGVRHVVQELSFTGEHKFDICDFLCSSVPQNAVHATECHPNSLAWSFKLTKCIHVCTHACICVNNIQVHVTLTPNPESEYPERQDADLMRGTVWGRPKVGLLDHSPCQVYILLPYTPAQSS
jgi:hypothetical protein